MALSTLLPELYAMLTTGATVGGVYLVWRFNPRRVRRQEMADAGRAQQQANTNHDRQVAAETHAALWGTPELVDEAGALVRRAQPGMMSEVRALRDEFPKNGKSARALLDEISDRQKAHQTELHEHTRAAEIVHNALWTALLDGNTDGPMPPTQGPPPAPVRGEPD